MFKMQSLLCVCVFVSDLSPAALRLPAAGVDVTPLSRPLSQHFDQVQTDASVGAGHQNVAVQFHRHVCCTVSLSCRLTAPSLLQYCYS